jgi:hypothetical protein
LRLGVFVLRTSEIVSAGVTNSPFRMISIRAMLRDGIECSGCGTCGGRARLEPECEVIECYSSACSGYAGGTEEELGS